jgi:signal transduction histidine kinase
MTVTGTTSPKDFIADHIHQQADELVEEWIRWITDVASLRPARMLPREAIRDHIPEVIREVSDALRSPGPVIQSFNTVKTHARLRQDQGYDIEELLKEYHGLSHIIGNRMLSALEQYPGQADPLAVARIFYRVSECLVAISDNTVGVYRSTEVKQRREMHQQLEDYVRTISHELKQPLHAITAGAGMLEEGGADTGDENRERYIQMIRTGIERSSSLIDDIRTLVLLEGVQQEARWQPLQQSVELVLRELSEHARKKDVLLEVPDPLPRIEVDATRAQIALVNLVSNAIKYADPEKPDRWVRIEAERAEPAEASRWEVRVADNGLGIPEHVQSQIFERHFRAHPQAAEGTGLGLAITRRLVEQGGGGISFESEEGRGSVFRFLITGAPIQADSIAETSRDRGEGVTRAGND